jgi:hypothetical protein
LISLVFSERVRFGKNRFGRVRLTSRTRHPGETLLSLARLASRAAAGTRTKAHARIVERRFIAIDGGTILEDYSYSVKPARLAKDIAG